MKSIACKASMAVIAALALLAPALAQQFVEQGSVSDFGSCCPEAGLGASVALSADGNTAVVGGRANVDINSVPLVWTRSGGVWTFLQMLREEQAYCCGLTKYGWSVALSADGNTALVGSPWDSGVGAAWVFTRSGVTWTRQGDKLVGSGAIGAAGQGYSVALSADGNTALIGGPGDNANVGTVWVFTRSGGVWTQQGVKLVGSGGIGGAHNYPGQGYSVALSADGNTALVGSPNDNGGGGAAWVFTRNGGVWMQQGSKLVGNGAVGGLTIGIGVTQGSSVALSADGNTAMVGGPGDSGDIGAAWIFTRRGGAWTQQGGKLVGSGASGSGRQGSSVAISADGNKAIVGSNVGMWVFKRSGGVWIQQGSMLGGSGLAFVGAIGAALSADGNTALVGTPYAGLGYNGEIWFFTVPVIRDLNGDGLSDALLYVPSRGSSYSALSNGDGTFSYHYNLFTPGFNVLRIGDFNGDDKADLALYNSQTALAYIGFGKGDGTFNFQSLFWSPGYDFVETGDLDGDGKTDVLLYNSSTGTMYTGISDGTGLFKYKYRLVSPGFTFVRLADFTGDGFADVLLYNSVNGFAYLGVGDGAGGFSFHPLSVSPGYDLADSGDLNGDGKMDILLYSRTTGRAATGLSDGAGGFTFNPLIFSPGFTSVRLADYTGDGKADVTVYNGNNGIAYFGTGDGTGSFAFQSLFWSPGYDVVEPQDLNGDGKADIVLYNSTTGTSYTGISNGAGGFSYTYALWGAGKVLAR